MKMSRQRAILLVMCWLALSAAAHAADSTLVLVMGGEAYDGAPKFEVKFDGKSLGQGVVAAAIDTAKAGRFADATDKTQYIQSFTFEVPQSVFRPDGDVAIEFLNEASGGEGSAHDRTLYVASVALNGRAVTASGLATQRRGAAVDNQLLGEFLVLPDGGKNVISPAPKGGWPLPVDQTIAGTLKSVVAEPLKTAVLDQNPEALSQSCDLDQIYNVIGFNENSNELTPKLIERLNQVASDIGDRQCNVQVTGYSSKQGAIASNALFAVERAQNSLKYLLQRGVKFVRASATGVGATDQFGPDFSSNRRVVISVTP